MKTAAQIRQGQENRPPLAQELRDMLAPPEQAQIAISVPVPMIMQIIEELEAAGQS